MLVPVMSGEGAQFDDMAIRIAQENLQRAIRPGLGTLTWHARLLQPLPPCIGIVDGHRKMSFTRHTQHLWFTTDQVQFLIDTDAKPRSRKPERRPGHPLQAQQVAIKNFAGTQVRHMQGDVIQLQDFQCPLQFPG